ncbi:PadR family transcriptional regulator [Microbacterium saccharophilum]|uniref:PadR family transcriptional regulator n=2 Tax=Microbacterium saccharophilum TaxID=1213358 RepID=A0A5C8IBP1_9MICO|nr:PadR family transcriptional regulator [Microbacterium saccharophilum]
MHPYEMRRLIRERRDDRLVSIANGTFYHVVGRLERDGLIVPVGVDRQGGRPERTTYSLTDTGRSAETTWLRRELPRIDNLMEHRVALAEAHVLPREEVARLLTLRRDALAAHRQDLRSGVTAAEDRGVPFQFLVELERETALLDADLAWLDTLLTRLADPGTAWGIHELPPTTRERLTAYRESVLA